MSAAGKSEFPLLGDPAASLKTEPMVSVGNVHLENPFILAPMAGIGDPPFRRLCRRGGAGMVCAEMVSANALHFGDERSKSMLKTYPDEHPVSMQVFGCEPDRLALAARMAEDAGADIVDLNVGCPVPKITKTGAGISLMRDESVFTRCVEAMVKAVKIPVTVKMRLGFRKGENHAVRFVPLAESAGVSAISIHARSQEDRHGGPPNLDALRETVASVKIPVFGNGGIKNYQEARWMMEQTGCAGVLIGQAAVGNPLIFKEFLSESHSPSPRSDRFDLLKEHAQMITAYYGEETGLRRLRKFIASYVKELPHAAEFRNKALSLLKLEDLFRVIDDFRNSLQAI